MSVLVARTVFILVTILSIALAGCVADPAMPLIPTPQRQATVLPSEAPETTPDGFANILADPATVAGLPRPAASIAREENALRADGAATARAAGGIRTSGSVAALEARGRNHVAETRAAIEAGARPQEPGAVPQTLSAAPPAGATGTDSAVSAASQDPGVPLDPAAPEPRAVGGPPFTGSTVAPPR
ncbi:MAG: hypothetical protein AcusKO_48390 [Acuticoccus sp.]